MKVLLSLTAIITLAAGSALLSAQADESVLSIDKKTAVLSAPVEVTRLETKLLDGQYDLRDRNTKLRVERAVHYFTIARKHADSGWYKEASEQANRGLSLLELNNMQYRQGVEVQM
ncbi:hypothetical protein [Paraglaciecola polaris]|uniref:Uncharacterized protein n=1 Tax=Paraglaciecola polaris LMG 21857 TaxID=1129793 RepID=K7AI07_9ALTE|nr:hypothetical protein [Paraglaciecola polaris]GAC34880.1 hypothetical protein GPLA_4001 [Paraglaciecola polaris LMG 21857]|tara:strand:+ start:387 stop:734 length:348 start_codon:yes stop_codon:yes gene_type:complete